MKGGRHLILGGSEGIGFAYALHCARQHSHLTIVARRGETLAVARDRLLDVGAGTVETVEGDLLDRSFRTSLWHSSQPFDSILAGGPSPPDGGVDDILSNECPHKILQGYEGAVAYPLEVMRWALGSGLRLMGSLYLIGSSASEGPILPSPFFLSASFRRILDQVARELEPEFEKQRKRIQVWRPRVVLTPLSIDYSQRRIKIPLNEDDARQFLEKVLGVPKVPTAEEYVMDQVQKEEGDE